jgi:two-component system, sensor histidine kinase
VQTLPTAREAQRTQILKNMNAALASVNDFMAGLHQLAGNKPATLNIQQTCVDEALAPVIDEYRHWCMSQHVSLRYVPANHTAQVDVQQLRRIARNLLSNALRYSGVGGRILVGCRRRAGQRWLAIVDTGAGMTPQQASQCFDAFKRFAPTRLAPEGMGLGLYSVKQAAHAMGLQTWLRSVPGKGTSVWVSLGPDSSAKSA